MIIGKNLLRRIDQEPPKKKYRLERHYLYFILDVTCNAVKIGISNNVNQRLNRLQGENLHSLKILKIIGFKGYDLKEASDNSRLFEIETHEKFKDYNIRREWFRYEGKLREFVEQING